MAIDDLVVELLHDLADAETIEDHLRLLENKYGIQKKDLVSIDMFFEYTLSGYKRWRFKKGIAKQAMLDCLLLGILLGKSLSK